MPVSLTPSQRNSSFQDISEEKPSPSSSRRKSIIRPRSVLTDVSDDSSIDSSRVTERNMRKVDLEPRVNATLAWLNISGNKIGSGGAKDLANVLFRNSSLTYLDISRQIKGKKVGPEGAREIAAALALNRLTLPSDGLAGRDYEPLEQEQGDNNVSRCQLKTLRCARNNIGFEGCRHLASSLLSNQTLTELDIGDVNYITIAGATQLANAITSSKSTGLVWLTIGEFRLPTKALRGDRCVYNRIKSLQRQKLREIYLRKQQLYDERMKKNTFQVGLEVLRNTIKETKDVAIKTLGEIVHPHETNEMDDEDGQNTEERPVNMSPKRPSRIVNLFRRHVDLKNSDEMETIENPFHSSLDLPMTPIKDDKPRSISPRVEQGHKTSPSDGFMGRNSIRDQFPTRLEPISLFPRSLHLRKIQSLNITSSAFTSSSEHGMNDEMAVVVGSLLQKNYNLDYLRLAEANLPILELLVRPFLLL